MAGNFGDPRKFFFRSSDSSGQDNNENFDENVVDAEVIDGFIIEEEYTEEFTSADYTAEDGVYNAELIGICQSDGCEKLVANVEDRFCPECFAIREEKKEKIVKVMGGAATAASLALSVIPAAAGLRAASTASKSIKLVAAARLAASTRNAFNKAKAEMDGTAAQERAENATSNPQSGIMHNISMNVADKLLDGYDVVVKGVKNIARDE
ncbi:MAG: hypothetical protein Q3962_08875 [Corynebacterium sp.]|nr:hypothetical protein [Corynebacterium sp.]